MANKKQTTQKAAQEASKILKDGRYSNDSKSVTGSTLSQTGTVKKQTSSKVAHKASNILNDVHYSTHSKSVAGSALSQTKGKIATKRNTDSPIKPKF
ncbi:MAG: hypothetical protein ACYCX2_11990 [Christensenellales bacterium]